MPTLTLTPSDWTYISKDSPTADHSGVYSIPTCNSPDKVDELQNNPGWKKSYPIALLQFTRPNTLKYKKITRAVLSWVSDTIYFNPVNFNYVAPYKSDEDLGNVNYNNYKEQGEVGEFVKGFDVSISGTYPSWTSVESFDIKSIFTNNIKNDVFNIFVCAGTYANNELSPPYNPSNSGGTYIVSGSVSLVVDYETATQEPPTPLYPKDTTVIEAGSTVFSWRFNSETEAVQASAVLQYKKSTDGSYTSVNIGTEHSYTLNSLLPAGTYQWRIKATNDAGDESNYSEDAYWNIIGQPSAPIIGDVPNKTLTTITWSSETQFACEVKLYDAENKLLAHETIATSEAFYKPNIFLKGSYTFMVRIKNSADLWSEWAQKAFAITAIGPAAGTMTVVPEDTSVRIGYSFSENAAIIRNGKVLAVLDQSTGDYIDDTVEPGKEYTYTLRTYVDGYTDTAERSATVNFGGATFRSEDGNIHLQLSEEKFIPYSETIENEMAVMKFSGREFPVIERGEFTEVNFTRKFFVTFEEKKILDKMCKAKSVFYRDNKGNALKCAIRSISYNDFKDIGYIATMSMIRTEEDEVIVNV